MPGEQTLFIGDVHGCAAELRALLDAVAFRAGRDRLYLTGDAFSRGPAPLEVWRVIERTSAEMVLGNHDDRLLKQLRGLADGTMRKRISARHQKTLDALQPVAESLRTWLDARPLFVSEDRFLLVHAGIRPDLGLAGTSRKEFLTLRTWPPTGDIVGPRWHEACPAGDRLVIFGHDAPGGLVDRRPHLLGLDSGCVYGHALSGYLLEEDRLVQVPAVGA